ncbi:MAG: hypothetical protein L6437_03600 [Kiritimatiellae bacterium]|nr:hypothetical protein [Kiritimatiellia bacterium]
MPPEARAFFDPCITRSDWPCGRLRTWHPALISKAATPRRLAISDKISSPPGASGQAANEIGASVAARLKPQPKRFRATRLTAVDLTVHAGSKMRGGQRLQGCTATPEDGLGGPANIA